MRPSIRAADTGVHRPGSVDGPIPGRAPDPVRQACRGSLPLPASIALVQFAGGARPPAWMPPAASRPAPQGRERAARAAAPPATVLGPRSRRGRGFR